jgi:hypothetical protein
MTPAFRSPAERVAQINASTKASGFRFDSRSDWALAAIAKRGPQNYAFAGNSVDNASDTGRHASKISQIDKHPSTATRGIPPIFRFRFPGLLKSDFEFAANHHASPDIRPEKTNSTSKCNRRAILNKSSGKVVRPHGLVPAIPQDSTNRNGTGWTRTSTSFAKFHSQFTQKKAWIEPSFAFIRTTISLASASYDPYQPDAKLSRITPRNLRQLAGSRSSTLSCERTTGGLPHASRAIFPVSAFVKLPFAPTRLTGRPGHL